MARKIRFAVLTFFVVIGFGSALSASAQGDVKVKLTNNTSETLTKVKVTVGRTTPSDATANHVNCGRKKKLENKETFTGKCKSAPILRDSKEYHAVRVKFVTQFGEKCNILKPDSMKRGKGFEVGRSNKGPYNIKIRKKDLIECTGRVI
jgi:hypothetical protein